MFHKVYCSDAFAALANLPDHSVDLILTDPDYSRIPQHLEVEGRKDMGDPEDNPLSWGVRKSAAQTIERLSVEANRLLTAKGQIYCYVNDWMLSGLMARLETSFPRVQALVWHKTNPPPKFRKRSWVQASEYIVWAARGDYRFNWLPFQGDMHNVWVAPVARIIGTTQADRSWPRHPAEKRVDFWQQMLSVSGTEGDLVVGPFCGGGSSGEAAVRTKCSWIGIDSDPRWAEVAERRIAWALKGAT